MAFKPDCSLPKQTQNWADLLGAYRLFNNPLVQPDAIQQPHRLRTLERCRAHKRVFCVQDTSTADYTHHKSKKGLGPIDRQNGKGLLQHTVLAVLPGGRVLGVLNQRWQIRVLAAKNETRKQRRARWRESLFWSEGVEAVGKAPVGTRFITIADRAADCFETFEACRKMDHGWIVRAQHDRCVNDKGDRLWSFLAGRPLVKTIQVKVPARTQKKKTNRGLGGRRQPARIATVEIRVAPAVPIDPPHGGDPNASPQVMNVVYAREIDAPPGVAEPIDWMLLSSEPVNSARAALAIIAWYRRRWVIEEYHKVQKSGCRLEHTQLHDLDALRRYAAIVGVCAVRMLWLRDLASPLLQLPAPQKKKTTTAVSKHAPVKTPVATADDPKVLAAMMPPPWIAVVAKLAATTAAELTARQFWKTIAQRGGWLARKHDGRPGWKALWDGWHDVALLVEGAILMGSG